MRGGWWAAVPLCFCASALWAAGRPDLRVEVRVERELRQRDERGERVVREPLQQARPGDLLVYTLWYRNAGDEPAREAVLADPVPDGTVLVRGSVEARDAAVQFSTDGKSFADWPKVRQANAAGEVEEVDAPPAAVRHVRVVLLHPVPAGAEGSASFKVAVQ